MAQPFKLEFPYRRSVGPIVGAFLTGLRDARILGGRTRDGRVLVPPLEYEPETGEAIGELVAVEESGSVTGWTSLAPTRRCSTPSTLERRSRWRSACGCGRAGASSARGT